MTEDKATRYHRLKRRSEVVGLLWSAVCCTGVLGLGWTRGLTNALSPLAFGNASLVVAAIVVALALIHEVVAFPLAWYSGLVLERRYGLSHQTGASWLRDHLKAGAIGLTLATAGAMLVYATMRAWPAWWWLAAGGAFGVIVTGLATLAPVVLLPLFFRFTPLGNPELAARLEQLAARAGTRIVGVYCWALGEKTRKANAALAGLGATRRIIVSDTMLDQYSADEIEVVLAHELAHHVHHDIWRGVALESALIVAGFFVTDVVLRRAGAVLGLNGIADPAGLPLLALAAGAVSVAMLPFALALSRRHERRADRFALDLTRNPDAFISAMRRLGAQNMAEERPSRIVQWLFYSHPPLEERIAAARTWAEAR